MRSIVDYTSGTIFLLIGIFFLVHKKMGWKILSTDPATLYFIGTIFVLYSLWRFYRGYKKNYYR